MQYGDTQHEAERNGIERDMERNGSEWNELNERRFSALILLF